MRDEMAHSHSVKWPDVGLRLGTWHTFPVAKYERLFSDAVFLRPRLKCVVGAGECGQGGGVVASGRQGKWYPPGVMDWTKSERMVAGLVIMTAGGST